MDRLTLALAQVRREKETLAVMFLDLDPFEAVNDTAGHTEGDRLLQSASERLWGLIREGDTVARVGGDEFAILLSGISQVEGAVAVSKRILKDFRRPWVLDGHEFHVTTSVGIAMYPDDGEDAETLLKNADAAMCRAKEQGRYGFQLYTPAMNVAVLERIALENDLRQALEREDFVLHYQPQVNVSSGRIVGMEALLRWQHPERGLVLPMEFIPVAEETGLILPLGEWVLRTACVQNKAWQEAGLPSMRVAVNLSARQFQSRELVNTVTKILEETGLDPDCLQLEITEGDAMQDTEFTAKVLHDLKVMGVQIVIDDFGTGHSSLSYLARFPIDALKIDRSFVGSLPVDQSAAAITAAIITLAHSLNLSVIAEGVETEEQLAFLKERKCDEFQGYLFSKPWPAEAFEAILSRGKRRARPKISADFP
ncbi:MAG: EAL domain-containing protein [Chloroflexi bacterium]|nr:EAL domain-containing protein [Chloroflexota bacterium]